MTLAPITPEEVKAGAAGAIPEFVLEAFNALLAQKARNGRATIYQDEVIDLILQKAPEPTSRDMIFNRNWLDVESIYRSAGWNVTYDKPAYCETYKAHFIFKMR
ncbi:hypothetical protein [Leisingera caerulea]|uniref:hypothetical protein n=1 Tax=Leisingera caerulea TaxID=506591 RepID=UPI00041E0B0E|nr:hypothetical protein [Leisingera caerulea]